MDYSKIQCDEGGRPRLNDRSHNDHTYSNGTIHDHFEVNQSTHVDTQRTKVDVINVARNELSNSTLPRICMTLPDGIEKPANPPSYNEYTRQASRQTGTEIDYTKYNNTKLLKNDHSQLESRDVPMELKCSMCQRLYNEPRFLPCLHSFCYHCLEEEVEHRTENRIRCPKCQRDYDLGVGQY